MSEKLAVPVQSLVASPTPQWVKHIFWGGIAGLVVGLGAAFVLAVLDGQASGMSPASCLAYGCALTVLFSHPAGLGGMVIGALLGALTGGGVYLAHRRHA
jgi:hypothetical protein